MKDEIVIFWFRRDLRIDDNTGFMQALTSGYKVLPLFIYDQNILGKLEADDLRISFIKRILENIDKTLKKAGSGLLTIYGTPRQAFEGLSGKYSIRSVYFNRDYEPHAILRDKEISEYLHSQDISSLSFKDQVIFEMSEIVKKDGTPYTVFTPYSSKWLSEFSPVMANKYPSEKLLDNCLKITNNQIVSPESLGFSCPEVLIKVPDLEKGHIENYDKTRDIPSLEGTSFLAPHLRFGTISIREVMRKTLTFNPLFTRELIWREFFSQILYNFPHVEEKSFKPAYDRIIWLNNEENFNKWCEGKTGFPLIDAGMRELNQTGYMHNRVRMVAANFLTRHLLTDWRWGEAWFAKKLLDFDLASNNGNWQWTAGTGCDAAPYFRIFNHDLQVNKFDPEFIYIEKWIPEYGTPDYPAPIVEHSFARERAVKYYREGIRPI